MSKNKKIKRKEDKHKNIENNLKTERYEINKKKLTILSIIYMICVAINIVDMLTNPNKDSVINYMILALANTLSISSILVLDKAPCLSILQLYLSQILVVIDGIIRGNTLSKSMENVGILELFSTLTIPIWLIIFWKNVNTYKNDASLKDKILNTVLIKRDILKAPLWVIFTTLCLVATAFFGEVNSSSMEMFGEHTDLKVLATISIILPSMVVATQYSTTNIAYIFRALLIPFQIYTVYYMMTRHNIEIATILNFVLETCVTVYVIMRYIKNEKERYIKTKDADSKKVAF